MCDSTHSRVPAAERQQQYRLLFRAKLQDEFLAALRAATNGGWALGDDRFQQEIAKMARRRATPLPKGRPPAQESDKRQLNLL